jgi:Flp pilus assembly protein TadG
MKRIFRTSRQEASRGQALIETALILTLLIILVGSIIEFGFMLNSYLAIQDAARNAARFSSDSLYDFRDNNHNCETTQDFYRQTACLVNMELAQARPSVTLTLTTASVDDIIVSAFSIAGSDMVFSPTVFQRYPVIFGELGWSAALDFAGSRHGTSRITRGQIIDRLDSNAPSTGFVLVEVISHYDQKLKLPWITVFLPDPFTLYTYALMPLVSAEPDVP